MSKKLAIKGHSTRGKEVIELLKMLGGRDSGYGGLGVQYYYYISQFGNIEGSSDPYEFNTYIVFTLEEFLEKYPYKVGDKVEVCETGKVFTIGNMIWEDEFYTVHYCNMEDIEYYTAKELKPYKEGLNMKDKEGKLFDSMIWHLRNSVNNGKQNLSGGECEDYFREVVKKNNENKMKSVLAEFLEHIKTTSKEELEREFEEIAEWSNVGPTVEEFRTFCKCVNKKPIYPKTYEKCCEKLGIEEDLWFVYEDIDGNHINSACISNYRIRGLELYHNLEKLKICRDAYWKLAGEQMGLGKSWEPNWNDSTSKYTIVVIGNDLVEHYTFLHNCILAFPIEEMRDTFYENFKDLIEQCKELL